MLINQNINILLYTLGGYKLSGLHDTREIKSKLQSSITLPSYTVLIPEGVPSIVTNNQRIVNVFVCLLYQTYCVYSLAAIHAH